LKILLVNPTNKFLITTNIPEYVQDSTGCLPPLGLLYIATNILRKSNHTVDIHDALLSDEDDAEIAEMSKVYDVIGITCMTFFLMDVINTVNSIREVNKEVPIVVGGPHVAIFP
jgi:anaerobic magnesium-protoporphyrin IX monomethyl ester cyclase